MLTTFQQTRSKVNVARIPPWRKWVRGRERIPSIAFNRSSNLRETLVLETSHRNAGDVPLIPTSKALSVGLSSDPVISGDSLQPDAIGNFLSSIRKHLAPRAALAKQAVSEIDSVCDSLLPSLATLTSVEKIRIACAFGQLREYSVSNRVADRYNGRVLIYQNSAFFNALVESMDWSSIYGSELKRFKTLSPLLHLVRSINKMGLDKNKVASILSPLFTDMVERGVGSNPKQLVELVMIASKNRVTCESFFDLVVTDLASNPNLYSEDLIGDLVRSLTTLRYYSEPLHAVLSQQLPMVAHELNWWNLIDIAEYYAEVIPQPFTDSDKEVIARLGNECWKWIPDMRCGYAAKGLQVLSKLGTGDKRTIRSLIRHIPRSLGKLHNNLVAQSIVSAAKVGYDPRRMYGKRYGSVLYRRLAGKLSSNEDSLGNVSADLIVSVVDALASITRPQTELFDQILRDIASRPNKYSVDHLLTLERLWSSPALNFTRGHSFIRKAVSATSAEHFASVKNLCHLAKSDPSILPLLKDRRNSGLVGLSVADLEGLLHDKDLFDFASSEWLDSNLPSMGPGDLAKLAQSFAESPHTSNSVAIALLTRRAEELTWTSLDDLVGLIASLTVLGGDFSSLVSLVTKQSTMSLETLRRCQLIAANIRTDRNISITHAVSEFLDWIENHLISKNFKPEIPQYSFYLPNGAESDLNVFPVTVPLAVPDPRLDLVKLHAARSSVAVRRVMEKTCNDAGIVLLMKPSKRLVDVILTERYLRRLGWSVRYIDPDTNFRDPHVVTQALLSGDLVTP